MNSDGIAQGNPVVNPDGSYAPCVGYPSLACEIDMAALRSTNGTWFGTPADADIYPGFRRQWSLESVLEVQHELLPRLSVTAGWTRSDDYNLRKTINRFRQEGDYVPVTIFNPITGDPITIYSIKDAATRARLALSGANLEYVEDERKAPYRPILDRIPRAAVSRRADLWRFRRQSPRQRQLRHVSIGSRRQSE